MTTSTDRESPALGTAFYYDVAGRNGCGEGPLGPDSNGKPRQSPFPCSGGPGN